MALREMRVVSDQYRQTMALLVLPAEIKPWERDQTKEEDGLEDTYNRFIRKGQLPVP